MCKSRLKHVYFEGDCNYLDQEVSSFYSSQAKHDKHDGLERRGRKCPKGLTSVAWDHEPNENRERSEARG